MSGEGSVRSPAGEVVLDRLVASLQPVRRPGEFVLVGLDSPNAELAVALVHDDDGITHVVSRAVADENGWTYELVVAWITLRVDAQLAPAGLAAVVSRALTDAGISCKLLAGLHHDHLLVPVDRAEEAVAVLAELSRGHRSARSRHGEPRAPRRLATRLEVERIAGSCGAIVRGLDLRYPQPPEQVERLLALLDEHLVVFCPDQHLDLDQLERFTDELGGRDLTPYIAPVAGRPYVIRVIKEATDELNFANAWHSDLSYLPEPPAYTVLHAWDVPTYGGDTIWANQHQAFDTLPTELQQRLLGLWATHSAGMAYGTGGYLEQVAGKSSMSIQPSPEAYAVETHPVVIRHPRTGRPALFVNPVYTTGIEGLDPDESRSLLTRLWQHSVHPNLTCRIRWQRHMLAIWDNRATQHLAINDYPGQRREMYRTSVKGSRPQPWQPVTSHSPSETAGRAPGSPK